MHLPVGRGSRYGVLAASLLLVAAVTATSGIGAAHRAPCEPGGSHTLVQNRDVRVYYVSVGQYEDRETFACKFSVGKQIELGEDSEGFGSEVVEFPTSARRWLGYALDVENKEDYYTDACALSLRTREQHCVITDTVYGLGVTQAGSLAWVGKDYDESCCYVGRYARGHFEVLDRGSEIGSFAVGGRRIYWTNDGVVKSATMP